MSQMNQQSAYTGVTAGVQLVNRACAVHLMLLAAGAAAAGVATLYDNTSATGNPIAVLAAPQGQSAYPDGNGYACAKGLYAVVTGAGAQLVVYVE